MRCRRCNPVPEEVRRAADLLERRWTISILYASYDGATRFNEFRQALEWIPPATLAARLVELEEAGVLERRVIDARPPLVEYRVTDGGRALRPAVEALARWSSGAVLLRVRWADRSLAARPGLRVGGGAISVSPGSRDRASSAAALVHRSRE